MCVWKSSLKSKVSCLEGTCCALNAALTVLYSYIFRTYDALSYMSWHFIDLRQIETTNGTLLAVQALLHVHEGSSGTYVRSYIPFLRYIVRGEQDTADGDITCSLSNLPVPIITAIPWCDMFDPLKWDASTERRTILALAHVLQKVFPVYLPSFLGTSRSLLIVKYAFCHRSVVEKVR